MGPRDAARPRFRSAATQIQEHRDPYLGHRGPNSLQIGSGLRTQAVNLRTQGPNLRSTQGPRFRPRDVGAQIQKRSDPDSGAQRPRFRSAGARMQDTGKRKGPNSGDRWPNSGHRGSNFRTRGLHDGGPKFRTQRDAGAQSRDAGTSSQDAGAQIQDTGWTRGAHIQKTQGPGTGRRGSISGHRDPSSGRKDSSGHSDLVSGHKGSISGARAQFQDTERVNLKIRDIGM